MSRRGILLSLLGAVSCAKPVTAPGECAGADCGQLCRDPGDVDGCTRAADLAWQGKRGPAFDAAATLRHAERGCNGGNALACALLGRHYESGLGTDWAPERAVTLFDKACTGGAGLGCFQLAEMYGRGRGVDVDVARADAYTERALASWMVGCAGAEPRWCPYAASLLVREDPAAARELSQRACDRNVASGCVQLLDAATATTTRQMLARIADLEKLCSRGEAVGCAALARMARRGGTAIKAQRFVELEQQACELGDALACMTMGLLHEIGRGVDKDAESARGYARRACDRGLAAACTHLGEQAAPADMAAVFQRGCERGSPESCEQLSRIHRKNSDQAAAIRWATEGCRLSGVVSCKYLVEQDRELPGLAAPDQRVLYRGACDDGKRSACERLAKLDREHNAVLHALADAIASRDTAAFARLAPASFEVRGLWFESAGCRRQFARRVVSAAEQPALMTCLASLFWHVEDAAGDHGPQLLYEPGVVVAVDARAGALRQIVGEASPQSNAAGPVMAPEALHVHQLGPRAVEPDPSARASVTGGTRPAVSAEVFLCVDPTGNVSQVKLTRSSNLDGYDRAVAAAVAAWTFTPFMARDKPVPVCTSEVITYPPERASPSRRTGPALLTWRGPSTGGGALAVEPQAIEANRIAGTKNITPDDGTRMLIMQSGQRKLIAAYKLCLNETGRVASVTQLRSSGFPDYDARIQQGIRAWRYLPFVVDGIPTSVCTAVTFVYSQR